MLVNRRSHIEVNERSNGNYLERWRIFLLRRMRRRVRFFFHFHRMAAVAFFHGLDLCPMAADLRVSDQRQ